MIKDRYTLNSKRRNSRRSVTYYESDAVDIFCWVLVSVSTVMALIILALS